MVSTCLDSFSCTLCEKNTHKWVPTNPNKQNQSENPLIWVNFELNVQNKACRITRQGLGYGFQNTLDKGPFGFGIGFEACSDKAGPTCSVFSHV